MAQPSPPWLINFRPNARAQLQLFCFPYAGGAAAAFRSWPDALAADIDLWAIEYPGHGARRLEAPLCDLRSLADGVGPHVLAAIRGRFAIFGHSMGALVGFEVLRRLRNVRKHPNCLIVSACAAPAVRGTRPADTPRSEAELIKELLAVNRKAGEILSDAELSRFVLPTLKADYEAGQAYLYVPGKRLSCPVFAYGGLSDPAVSRGELAAWREETDGGFSLRMFAGDHFYLHAVEDTLLSVLARDLLATAPVPAP